MKLLDRFRHKEKVPFVVPETLMTARLLLRKPMISDAMGVFEYASDPEVTRYMEWPTHTKVQTALDFIQNSHSRWESKFEFLWMVSLRSNDKIIGATSCRIQDELAGFGYCIHRDYWCQGFATEAAGAIVEWVVSLPGIRRIWATCDFENEKSMRVLEKMGLTREKRLRHYSVRPNISMKLRDAFLYSKKIYRS